MKQKLGMNLFKSFFVIFSLILEAKHLLSFNYCPEYGLKCECLNTFSLNCENFFLLDELNFPTSTRLTLANIFIRPRQSIIFNYTSLFNLFNNLSLRPTNTVISLSNFRGFDIFKNPFTNLRTDQTIQLFLQFNDTILDFYTNNKLIDEKDCDDPNFNSALSLMFSPFDVIIFYDTVRYPQNLCPKVFANSFLSEIYFYNFNNINKFIFYSTDLSQNLNQLRVEKLFFVNSQIIFLDSGILNRNLFQNILSLNFYGVFLTRIEENLLASFKNLRTITLDLHNFKDLIYNLNWFRELNSDFSNVNPVDADMFKSFQVEILLGDRTMNYEFSNEDLCLFKDFPHSKLVYPSLSTKVNLTCSCTVMWLIQYYKYYQFRDRLETRSIANCINDTLVFEQTIRDCNLIERINTCNSLANSNQAGLKDWQLALSISLPLAFVLILAIIVIVVIMIKKKRQVKIKKSGLSNQSKEPVMSSGTVTYVKKYTTFNGRRTSESISEYQL